MCPETLFAVFSEGYRIRRILNGVEKVKDIQHERKREISKTDDFSSTSIFTTQNNGLHILDEGDSVQKTKVIKYQETFKSLPIYNAFVTEEFDLNTGAWTGQMSGEWYEELEQDITSVVPLLSKQQALSIAMSKANIKDPSIVKNSKIKLIIVPLNGTGILCYDVTLLIITRKSMKRPGMFIDANSGQVLRTMVRLRQSKLINAVGGNKKTTKIEYGKDFPLLKYYLDKTSKKCALKSDYVEVFDLQNATEPSEGAMPYEFVCSEGVNDEINGGFSPMSDAFYMGHRIFDMYKSWAHTDLISDPPLKIWVHYGNLEMVALFNGLSMMFGDGNEKHFYPLVTYDVFAHEAAHAFTEHHSYLEYENQPGAIDEAYSDLVGEAFEYFITGTFDLHIGEQSDKLDNEAIRDMCDQNKDGQSIIHIKDYYDGIEVHLASGILNKVSCILIKQPSFGIKKVFQTYTHANKFYWKPDTNFSVSACGILKAAYDLGYDQAKVREAFMVVGISTCKLDEYIRKIYGNTHISGLNAKENESIIFGVTRFTGQFIRIYTEGGIGDVDIYGNYEIYLDISSSTYSSTNKGNMEIIQIRTNDCWENICYIHLLPKVNGFTNVTFQVEMI